MSRAAGTKKINLRQRTKKRLEALETRANELRAKLGQTVVVGPTLEQASVAAKQRVLPEIMKDLEANSRDLHELSARLATVLAPDADLALQSPPTDGIGLYVQLENVLVYLFTTRRIVNHIAGRIGL